MSGEGLHRDTGRLEDDSSLGAVGGLRIQESVSSQSLFGGAYYSPPPQAGYEELLVGEELSPGSSPTLTDSGSSLFPGPSSSFADRQLYTHKGEPRQRQPKQYRKDMTQEEFEEYKKAEVITRVKSSNFIIFFTGNIAVC